eukprot:7918432-Pyramimonas_sp.AAC.1
MGVLAPRPIGGEGGGCAEQGQAEAGQGGEHRARKRAAACAAPWGLMTYEQVGRRKRWEHVGRKGS